MKRLTQALLAFIILISTGILLPSCNTNSSKEDDPDYVRGSELIVTKFSIQPNIRVMPHLDSVYFAIDLNKGLIFNADSLPMGTPINRLLPLITYSSSVETATIIVRGETDEDVQVIDYKKNPGDSIDFTKTVTLELSALNGTATKTYRLMVNVHKMNPDSLTFDTDARMALPSRLPNPQNQKTISRDGTVYTFIEERDNSYTLATTKDMAIGQWQKHELNFGFEPNLTSLSTTSDSFFILSANNKLYRSTDALIWQCVDDCTGWTTILGGFGSHLEGLKTSDDGLIHTQYPLDNYQETAVESDFPVKDFSNLAIYTTKWSNRPLGLITGGETSAGLTGNTWAFDGYSWCKISNTPLPPVAEGTMLPYFAYLKSSAMWIFNEYSIWMYIGGRTADGSPNKTLYISYDNGVNWKAAPATMQLPETIIANAIGINHAVIDTPLSANFSIEAWKTIGKQTTKGSAKMLPYVINGYEITWNCPYIYLVGGFSQQTDENRAMLSPWIYRGVLNRMTFKPLI